jgi:hypothetical protein
MTSWTDMPWTVMRDEGAVARSLGMAEAIEDALSTMHDAQWRRMPLNPRMNASWAWDRTEVDGTTTSMTIKTYTFEHLVHIDVRIAGDGERNCSVRCHGSLIGHPDETPVGTARVVARLLDAAANAERVLENQVHLTRTHEELTPAEAVMMMTEATEQDIDITRPFEVERWGPTPLAPSSASVDQDDAGTVRETEHDAPTTYVRLSLMSGGAVWLQPSITRHLCSGFDVIETLRIHRELEG